MIRLRSPHDREILLLAVPALGALAAEPLYVLVDTAIVGHLGTTQLAALAIAATVMSTAFTVFNFLTYGTTAQVARLHGARRDDDAAALGSQALYYNSTGQGNTAGGAFALLSNTTGAFNTASGYAALFSNTVGASNSTAKRCFMASGFLPWATGSRSARAAGARRTGPAAGAAW